MPYPDDRAPIGGQGFPRNWEEWVPLCHASVNRFDASFLTPSGEHAA